MSIIGLNGEPSFYDVEVKNTHHLSNAFFTGRELEIVKELIIGKSTMEIAEKFSISVYTVDTHRKNTFKKTKAKNTNELFARVYKDGLL